MVLAGDGEQLNCLGCGEVVIRFQVHGDAKLHAPLLEVRSNRGAGRVRAGQLDAIDAGLPIVVRAGLAGFRVVHDQPVVLDVDGVPDDTGPIGSRHVDTSLEVDLPTGSGQCSHQALFGPADLTIGLLVLSIDRHSSDLIQRHVIRLRHLLATYQRGEHVFLSHAVMNGAGFAAREHDVHDLLLDLSDGAVDFLLRGLFRLGRFGCDGGTVSGRLKGCRHRQPPLL